MNNAEAPRILAVVLNWQQGPLTLASVAALRAMAGPQPDILVIDNGSQDESVALLHAEAAELGFEFLALPQNRGFAAANNIGLQRALEGGYVHALLLNNDAFAAPDMLERLLAESRSDMALLSPKIFYDGDRQRIWFANGSCDSLTLDLKDTGQGELDGPRWVASRDVDYLLGTCLLVNLAAARVVGLLDERFFFYFEDLDWSLRFREAGYRLRLVADAHLYHRVAVSTGGEDDSPQRRYYLAYGGVRFWRRHLRLGSPPAIVAFRTLSGVKMVARLMIHGRMDAAAAYLRGLRDGWQAGN